MKGYWLIVGTDVSDPEAQAEYGRLWKPIAERYQARLNPIDVSSWLQEARDARRVIIVEFPSPEIARACYDDPAYAEAKSWALKASNRELLMLKGELA